MPGAPQYVTFALSGIELGIDVLGISQIIEYVEPSPMPHLPPVVCGVIDHQGHAVPVVDLARKLGLEVRPATRRSCILIVESREAGLLGLLADSVREVIDVPAEEVLPAPTLGGSVRADYLLGVGKAGSRLVLLIDPARLLSPAELTATSLPPPDEAPAT
jgi:purine-binding chemotaxis protein CheW